MKNTDQVIYDYLVERNPAEDTNKAYAILGTGHRSFTLDSASKKDVEESKSYITQRMKSTLTYVSLRNQRILPVLHWDENKRNYAYKIYRISIDPKAVAALMDQFAQEGYTTSTTKNFLIYINERNQIFNVEVSEKS